MGIQSTFLRLLSYLNPISGSLTEDLHTLVRILHFICAVIAIRTMYEWHCGRREKALMEAVRKEALWALLSGDMRFDGPELTHRETAELSRRLEYFLDQE